MLFTSDYDLPNSLVNKIAEDSYGLIWVATEDGLCSFNGSRFTTYRNIAGDENSISSNFIRTVCTDSRGNVVVGTVSGVQVYNRHENNFSKLLNTESIGLRIHNVNDLCPLKNGDYAVIGKGSYNIHINDDGTVVLKRNAFSNRKDNGSHIMEDTKGNLWAGYEAKGVWCADNNGHVRNIVSADGKQYDFAVFCCDNNGKVYAGHSAGGLYCYNERTRHFDFMQGTESLMKIRDIKQIPNTSLLCVGTDGEGIHIYDVKTHSFVNSNMFDDPFIDISSQKVHSLYINKVGDIWIGLYQKGIFMATKAKSLFGYVGARSQKYNIIGSRCVTSIIQRRDGSIWVGTDNGGLHGITPQLQAIRSFPANDMHGLPASLVTLFEDSKGRLWFGSFNHGCGVVDVNTGGCRYATLKGVNSWYYSVYGFVEDKRGQLWAGSMGKGVLRYDEEKNEFQPYIDTDGTTWTGTVFYDKDNDRIYCGTYDGIVWFSPTDKTRKTHSIGNKIVVYSISRLSKTTIGFGTTDGISILDTKTGNLRQVAVKNGLSNSNIFALQLGTKGDIWMSSGGGLMRYDIKTNAVESFTMKDGLQGNEFFKNASLVSSDGRLWFGGVNGITVFNPSNFNSSKNLKCTSRVVGLRAGERYLCADENGCYTVPNGVDVFNVELATLPLYMTHRVTYYYRMDSGDWVMLPGTQNRVVFDNVSSGSHTLYTKVMIDDVESEVTETEIYVKYPWFLRWWANIIWLVVLAAIAYHVRQFLKRRREIRESLIEHEREEELKESKLQFFMNVVHDLRTPLTLIQTPLQKLKSMGDDSHHQRLYEIMNRNTNRLLKLTNEIMDLRKLDTGKMQLFPHNAYISKHILNITDSMSDMLETRHQQLILTDHTDGKQMMIFDAQAFEKILVNLLGNAIKYTQEGGQIEVEWDIVDSLTTNLPHKDEIEDKCLVLSVTDNGIGISDEDKQHIFERFYQVRVNDKHIKGTGIGLDLVRSLVELHKGEITVSDNPSGKGTRFTIIIPNQEVSSVAESYIQQTTDTEMDSTVDLNAQESSLACSDTSDDVSSVNTVLDDISKRSVSKKTVLIADDDDDIRTFLCEEMAASFNIVEASNGKQAFEIINQRNIDLVVSDVMMPEMDGLELTRKIRDNIRLAHIPIILLTAKASDQDRIEGLQASADMYVTKPFNIDLLQTLIVNFLVRNDKLQISFKGNELPADRIDTPEVQSADDKLMERLLKVINDNLSNPDLTTDFLAQESGLSRGHLYRKLKELTNQSATNFIRNIRLTKAAELLSQKRGTISEIAYLVGFRTPTHFSTAFKELYGMTPREYMKKDNE